MFDILSNKVIRLQSKVQHLYYKCINQNNSFVIIMTVYQYEEMNIIISLHKVTTHENQDRNVYKTSVSFD